MSQPSGFFAPFRRLKWGFIPVRREVEDYPEEYYTEKLGESADEHEEELQLEYRDEANRPWWKFFDEYEYRINKKTRKHHKWYKWFNESDTPAERKLIIKLDILLTFYSMMAYWAKYLDQTNLNNAYVSGMREELGFKGNDLVIVQAMFTVGSIIFQIPFMYILHRLPMNYVLPLLDLCWSCFTIGIYRVNSVSQLKCMRFFVGVFEAPAYLAFQFLFGSFYKYDEIVRRSLFYYCGQYLGVCTSGLLQGKLYNSLGGVNGLSGWRWMFIIDAVISFGVGIIGFYSLPGTPQDCYSIFLTDDEIRLARRRMKNNNTASVDYSKKFFDKKVWIKILTSWQLYCMVLWNVFCWNNNNGTSGAYLLWLKSLKRFSVSRLNQISAITPALGILWLILVGCYADLFHSRWQAIVISQAWNFIGNVILAVWYVPERAKWFAFMLQYFGWAMAPVLYSWMNDICRRDVQSRAVILVIMNMLAQTSTAWISVLVFKTVEAPRYLKGYTWTAVAAFCLSAWTFVVLYFYKRDERRYAIENGIVVYNSKTGENYPLENAPSPVGEKEEGNGNDEIAETSSITSEEVIKSTNSTEKKLQV